MSRSLDKKGFVYTLDVFIAVGIIVAGSWILMFNLFSQSDTLRPRIISDDLISESYGKRIGELNYPQIQNFSRNGTIADSSKSFSEQIGEFYWLSIKRNDSVYLTYARTMIDEYYRGIIPSQYQFIIRIGDFNDPVLRTDAVYFRTDSLSLGGVLGGQPLGHSCSIREDGILLCWGNNQDGQLGSLTGSNSNPEAIPVDSNLSFRQVSAGEDHTCAIDSNNSLYCWGSNQDGRLGIGSTGSNFFSPRFVGHNYLQVSAGGSHTCAIRTDRTVWCWGLGSDGRLGLGNTATFNEPQQVDSGAIYQTISAGVDHTCGLRVGGDVYCWGNNNVGQLGIGSTSDSNVPVRAGTRRYLTVETGNAFSCGIEATLQRSIFCWGDNKHTSGRSESPSILLTQPGVVNENFSHISLGSNHGCAIGVNQNAYCWGMNNLRQLGITSGGTHSLVKVLRDGPYSLIAAGPGHSCALRAENGTMNCWGANMFGQSGQASGGQVQTASEITPTDYTYLSNELRVLHSRNNTPMNSSSMIIPSRTVIAGIDRDNQFYGPFVFEVVVWI